MLLIHGLFFTNLALRVWKKSRKQFNVNNPWLFESSKRCGNWWFGSVKIPSTRLAFLKLQKKEGLCFSGPKQDFEKAVHCDKVRNHTMETISNDYCYWWDDGGNKSHEYRISDKNNRRQFNCSGLAPSLEFFHQRQKTKDKNIATHASISIIKWSNLLPTMDRICAFTRNCLPRLQQTDKFYNDFTMVANVTT